MTKWYKYLFFISLNMKLVFTHIYTLKCMLPSKGWLSHMSNCLGQCVYELRWDTVY